MSARNKRNYPHFRDKWRQSGALSPRPKNPFGTDTLDWRDQLTIASNQSLLDQYRDDILYDAHSLQARISRSHAGQELIRRGKKCLRDVGKYLEKTFPSHGLEGNKETLTWDHFIACISMLYSIVEEHRIPNCPFPGNVPYGDQNPQAWTKFCMQY